MIIVPTIRNTGSHFVIHNLLGKRLDWRNDGVLSWRTPGRTPDSVIFDHVFPSKKHLYLPLISDPENITIVPLRHPYLTEKSWLDRGHETDDLLAMWDVMINWIAPLAPNFLPLDVSNRQTYLDALNKRTGLALRTDWRPAGSKQGNSALRHKDVQPSQAFVDFVSKNKDFFDIFYAEAN